MRTLAAPHRDHGEALTSPEKKEPNSHERNPCNEEERRIRHEREREIAAPRTEFVRNPNQGLKPLRLGSPGPPPNLQ